MALGLRGYGYGKKIDLPFEKAREEVIKLLESEQFVVKELMDIEQFYVEHFDGSYKPYQIYSLFHPEFVKNMLEIEPSLGVILPCNLIIYFDDENKTGISVMDPISQIRLTAKGMKTVEQGMALKETTTNLDRKLRKFLWALEQWKNSEDSTES